MDGLRVIPVSNMELVYSVTAVADEIWNCTEHKTPKYQNYAPENRAQQFDFGEVSALVFQEDERQKKILKPLLHFS